MIGRKRVGVSAGVRQYQVCMIFSSLTYPRSCEHLSVNLSVFLLWSSLSAVLIKLCIGSVLHQDEGGIGESIPDAQEISRDPKDFPRAKPEGNLEGRGDGFPNNSRVLVEDGHSLNIN